MGTKFHGPITLTSDIFGDSFSVSIRASVLAMNAWVKYSSRRLS